MAFRKIQLIIRDSGLGSRRRAEELIRQGHVTLNGKVVVDPGVSADPEKDHIKVNGKLVARTPAVKSYYLFNKPRNVMSTLHDPEGRPCIGDVLKTMKKGLFPIGRLDFDAEGLMILTNDGALAERLSHPSHSAPRTYMVKVRGNPDDKALGKIRKGMDIGRGDRVGEIKWRVTKRQKTSAWIRIVLFEGKKNELKRIFYRIGHPARKIRRIGFGPFSLGKLPAGQWRDLTRSESSRIASLL